MHLLKGRDFILDFLFISLITVGLYSLFSISVSYFQFQLIFTLISLFIYVLIIFLNKDFLKILFFLSYFFVLILLIYLYIFGDPIRGSISWISIGQLALQPSEFAKISLVYLTALIFSSPSLNIKRKLVYFLLILTPIVVLVLIQPDLGTTFAILLSVSTILFISTINKKTLIYSLFLATAVAVASYGFLQDYQKSRIRSFLNPEQDRLGSGYNVIQSMVAIGSGGVFGKGFKQNTQVTYRYLPEAHTDFIFASVSESFGLFYSLVIILLLFGMCYRIFYKQIKNGKDVFNVYFCSGFFMLLILQSSLNIGMNLGLMPITGLPLPFISYGGSSLLTFSIFLALVQRFNAD